MSTKLSWFTSVFMTRKFFIFTVMTIASSWVGFTPLKSASLNVMGGFLCFMGNVTALMPYTACRCFFLADMDNPPLAKPSYHTRGLFRLLVGVI